MRFLLRVIVPVVMAFVSVAAAAVPVAADPPHHDAWDTDPVEDLLERVLGDRKADQFTLRALPADGTERFVIGRSRQRVQVAATTPSALLSGVNAYLDRVAGVDVSWNGDSLDRLPRRLPLPDSEIRQEASVANRFGLNDTDDGYTGAYRTWKDWEREIDVLALHGINQVFVPVGAEAVYLDAFQRFGYTAEELRAWIPQPTHQPWWLLQNMSGFPSAVTAELVEERAELGARIVERLRELGMTPVLPGYFGTVPPGFTTKVPDARTVPQGKWVGFDRPDWLDPTSPAFARVAEAFYDSSKRLFGATTHYKMDLLHEGGTPGPVPVGPASKAVQDALETARPGGIWVFLGWQSNPRPDTLAAIDRSRIFIVDGLSDRYTDTDRNRDWPDSTWAFGAIWNYGGHTTMGANTAVWEDRFWRWRAESGSTLDGIALIPEASDNNPAAFDYITGLAWRDGPVAPADWFADWAARRYGGGDASAKAAWRAIGATAYAMPPDGFTQPQSGLFSAQPSLTTDTPSIWSPKKMRYNPTAFAAALPAMLDVDEDLRDSSAYRYDLVDVARQVLSNRSRTLLPQIKGAFDREDAAEFERLSGLWIRSMELMEALAATNSQTMLGPWLADARSWGENREQADALETSARTLLTVWGTRDGFNAGLADYANREWSGLIGTYYLPRWRAYFDELSAALAEDRAPKAFHWYAVGTDWSAEHGRLAMKPRGDVHAIAERILDLLRANPEPLTSTATVSPGTVPDGSTATVTATVRNTEPFATATGGSATLTVPEGSGLHVRQPTVDVPDLAPGGSATVTFTVDATEAADTPLARMTVTATASTGTSVNKVRVVRVTTVEAPNLTRTTNSSVFGQVGDRYLIDGGGNDLWGTTKHFGAIYRDGVLTDGTTITTRVVSQDRTGPWARSGLIIGTDLSGNISRGFANIALTPDKGCVFAHDSNNDGTIDRNLQAPGFSAPLWVRLTRVGDTVTGSCSADGTKWTDAGSFVVPAGVPLDAGLFMTAANGGSGARGAVEFDGFTVT
ncbi:alpha-N-acetylglucosaminidase [Phytomonospora endophytica]|uniref:Alpha-N-acetylglucosaminidase n=1 Tax=Phytomonospora endophytica TaxID=714109 RepID=A0A841FQE5_9ACTN|nr:alpha-N-acetylglucosaminidase TIM-barrel domain-containing protein [Phytomonospora endophytica]MBB6034180.1 alpha-N-acetylglucosaminidase [Phytomonospora endophytica]